MWIKLFILPIYVLLPFSLTWFGSSYRQWWLPFLIWLTLIILNAVAERVRGTAA